MVRSKKRISHSKTLWFSFVLMVFGVVLDNFSYLQDVIPTQWYGPIFMGVSIVVAVLRFTTTKPI